VCSARGVNAEADVTFIDRVARRRRREFSTITTDNNNNYTLPSGIFLFIL